MILAKQVHRHNAKSNEFNKTLKNFCNNQNTFLPSKIPIIAVASKQQIFSRWKNNWGQIRNIIASFALTVTTTQISVSKPRFQEHHGYSNQEKETFLLTFKHIVSQFNNLSSEINLIINTGLLTKTFMQTAFQLHKKCSDSLAMQRRYFQVLTRQCKNRFLSKGKSVVAALIKSTQSGIKQIQRFQNSNGLRQKLSQYFYNEKLKARQQYMKKVEVINVKEQNKQKKMADQVLNQIQQQINIDPNIAKTPLQQIKQNVQSAYLVAIQTLQMQKQSTPSQKSQQKVLQSFQKNIGVIGNTNLLVSRAQQIFSSLLRKGFAKISSVFSSSKQQQVIKQTIPTIISTVSVLKQAHHQASKIIQQSQSNTITKNIIQEQFFQFEQYSQQIQKKANNITFYQVYNQQASAQIKAQRQQFLLQTTKGITPQSQLQMKAEIHMQKHSLQQRKSDQEHSQDIKLINTVIKSHISQYNGKAQQIEKLLRKNNELRQQSQQIKQKIESLSGNVKQEQNIIQQSYNNLTQIIHNMEKGQFQKKNPQTVKAQYFNLLSKLKQKQVQTINKLSISLRKNKKKALKIKRSIPYEKKAILAGVLAKYSGNNVVQYMSKNFNIARDDIIAVSKKSSEQIAGLMQKNLTLFQSMITSIKQGFFNTQQYLQNSLTYLHTDNQNLLFYTKKLHKTVVDLQLSENFQLIKQQFVNVNTQLSAINKSVGIVKQINQSAKNQIISQIKAYIKRQVSQNNIIQSSQFQKILKQSDQYYHNKVKTDILQLIKTDKAQLKNMLRQTTQSRKLADQILILALKQQNKKYNQLNLRNNENQNVEMQEFIKNVLNQLVSKLGHGSDSVYENLYANIMTSIKSQKQLYDQIIISSNNSNQMIHQVQQNQKIMRQQQFNYFNATNQNIQNKYQIMARNAQHMVSQLDHIILNLSQGYQRVSQESKKAIVQIELKHQRELYQQKNKRQKLQSQRSNMQQYLEGVLQSQKNISMILQNKIQQTQNLKNYQQNMIQKVKQLQITHQKQKQTLKKQYQNYIVNVKQIVKKQNTAQIIKEIRRIQTKVVQYQKMLQQIQGGQGTSQLAQKISLVDQLLKTLQLTKYDKIVKKVKQIIEQQSQLSSKYQTQMKNKQKKIKQVTQQLYDVQKVLAKIKQASQKHIKKNQHQGCYDFGDEVYIDLTVQNARQQVAKLFREKMMVLQFQKRKYMNEAIVLKSKNQQNTNMLQTNIKDFKKQISENQQIKRQYISLKSFFQTKSIHGTQRSINYVKQALDKNLQLTQKLNIRQQQNKKVMQKLSKIELAKTALQKQNDKAIHQIEKFQMQRTQFIRKQTGKQLQIKQMRQQKQKLQTQLDALKAQKVASQNNIRQAIQLSDITATNQAQIERLKKQVSQYLSKQSKSQYQKQNIAKQAEHMKQTIRNKQNMIRRCNQRIVQLQKSSKAESELHEIGNYIFNFSNQHYFRFQNRQKFIKLAQKRKKYFQKLFKANDPALIEQYKSGIKSVQKKMMGTLQGQLSDLRIQIQRHKQQIKIHQNFLNYLKQTVLEQKKQHYNYVQRYLQGVVSRQNCFIKKIVQYADGAYKCLAAPRNAIQIIKNGPLKDIEKTNPQAYQVLKQILGCSYQFIKIANQNLRNFVQNVAGCFSSQHATQFIRQIQNKFKHLKTLTTDRDQHYLIDNMVLNLKSMSKPNQITLEQFKQQSHIFLHRVIEPQKQKIQLTKLASYTKKNQRNQRNQSFRSQGTTLMSQSSMMSSSKSQINNSFQQQQKTSGQSIHGILNMLDVSAVNFKKKAKDDSYYYSVKSGLQ